MSEQSMTVIGRWRWPRWAIVPSAAALGAIGAGLHLRNGKVGSAVFMFALMAGFGLYVAFSKSEWAVVQSDDLDERQRSISLEATRLAYGAVITVAVIGFFTEIARDQPGPFTIICSVGGFTQLVALQVLKNRR